MLEKYKSLIALAFLAVIAIVLFVVDDGLTGFAPREKVPEHAVAKGPELMAEAGANQTVKVEQVQEN